MNDVLIDLKDLTFYYDGEKVLDDLSLQIRDKEFVTLLGPSGCGKTTTLRIIGGFLTPHSGDVFLMGKGSMTFRPIRGKSIPFFSGMPCFRI